MKNQGSSLVIALLLMIVSCENPPGDKVEISSAIEGAALDKNGHDKVFDLKKINPISEDGNINVLVEIPAGSLEKWEVNKESAQLELEHIDGQPRIVQYLGYPGNYGMVPGTFLPKEFGGDGDPLDVLVLGPPAIRGEVIKCKIVAVLNLLDRGEQDDKLIAVMEGSPLYEVDDLDDLKENYKGSLEIIELWFINYKGPGKMISNGFQNKAKAQLILNQSILENKKN